MKNFKFRKLTLIFLLGIVILGISPALIAMAQTEADKTVAGHLSFTAQVIGYILGFIGGVLMSIAGYLTAFALGLNQQILNSPIVLTGWKVVLNVTNLGFVLAIIIIAFATIFRVQSYQMKQVIWKLIIAALLVNFSLVIAGAFIDISQSLANFFLFQGGITDPVQWTNAFVGMFKAQALLKTVGITGAASVWDTAKAVINLFTGVSLQTIASIFFIALFTTLTALTLLTLAIMLLIRYVYIGVLLILSPIVWLLWIFPNTKHLWQKWWKKFLQWTFFAPIALFFIYLAMHSMRRQPETIIQLQVNLESAKIVNLTFGIEIIGDMIIAIGLTIGGLIVAYSSGIMFADTAYGWAKSIGRGFGFWAGRKAVRAGTSPLRTERAEKIMEKLQKTGGTRGALARLATLPIRKLGEFGSRLAREPVRYISEAEKKIEKLSPREKALRWMAADTPTKIAIAQDLRKSKDLDALINAGVPPEEIIKTLGQMKKYKQRDKDVTEVVPIFDPKIWTAVQNKNFRDMKINLTEFLRDLSPAKWSNVQWRDIIGGKFKGKILQDEWKKDFVPVITESVIGAATAEGMSNLHRSLKEAERADFHEAFIKLLDEGEILKSKEEREKKLKEINPRLAKFFESTLAANLGLTLESEKKETPKFTESAGI